MFFNKKKREDKKRLAAEIRQSKDKATGLAQEFEAKRQELAQNQGPLSKELKGTQSTPTGLLAGLKKGLAKTRSIFSGSILALASGELVDNEFLEELEERLLSADLGVATSLKVIDHLRGQLKLGQIKPQAEAITSLKALVAGILDLGDPHLPLAQSGPTVYLFVGVNGVGKTTSIGKLAAQLKGQGKKVLVAAGDTFRAAAIEQLAHWCEKVGVDCLAKPQNSDPSAVLYEAAQKAQNEGYDVLLCDTSGRLHNKKNLMDELAKMERSLQKVLPEAPHAALLVLDANTGQNAIMQAKEFREVVALTGLVVTKLDGTAKGGVIIGIVNEFELPVYFIGVGERVEDLQPFVPHLFAESLLS